MSVRAKSIRSVFWLGLETTASFLASMATLLILARLLDERDFGVAAIGLTIAHFLAAVCVVPVGDAIVQRKKLSRKQLEAAFTLAFGLSLVGMAVCFALAPAMNALFTQSDPGWPLMVMALSLPLMSFEAALSARLRRIMRFQLISMVVVASRVGAAAIAITGALAGLGYWSLAIQQIAAPLIAAALLPALGVPYIRLRFDMAAFKDILKFTGPLMGIVTLYNINLRAFLIFVGVAYGERALGQLHLAMRFITPIFDMVTAAIYKIALPSFARKQADPAALQRGYAESTKLVSVVTFPIFAGLALVAPTLIPLAAGEGWSQAVHYAQIVSVGLVLTIARNPAGTFLVAMGRPVYNLINLSINTTGLVAMLFTLGLLGPAYAVLAHAMRPLIGLPFGLWAVRRVLQIAPIRQLAPLAPAAIATLVMTAAVLAVNQIMGWGGVEAGAEASAFMALGTQMAIGAFSYAAVIFVIERATMRTLADIAFSRT